MFVVAAAVVVCIMTTLSVKVSSVESDNIFAKWQKLWYNWRQLTPMKTYDHQKYFPKVLHKNFALMARVKHFYLSIFSLMNIITHEN